MHDSSLEGVSFTQDELQLLAEAQFFVKKARIMKKVRALLDELYTAFQQDISHADLLAPKSFDPTKVQFVKGEHLEDHPYQYLDFPKYFDGEEKFTVRSLFWWGHAFVFALIVEGGYVAQCKQNLVNRYHQVAGNQLHLSLSPSPWEWKSGEGYTLPLTHERKPEVAAVLSGRRFFKVARYVRLDDPIVVEGRIVQVGRDALRSLLPIMTR